MEVGVAQVHRCVQALDGIVMCDLQGPRLHVEIHAPVF